MREFTLKRRSAGILLHLSSLPGPHGTGDLGPEARRFAEFLSRAGQRWWQMLPVGPIGPGNSPYSSTSSFAGEPVFISLELLAREGLLEPSEMRGWKSKTPEDQADYREASDFKNRCLRKAFDRFKLSHSRVWKSSFRNFDSSNAWWLDDFVLFSVLNRAHKGVSWTRWPRKQARRDPDSLAWVRKEMSGEIEFLKFQQYLFFRQWEAFKRHCESLGVGLIGDIPIYVDHQSADVWTRPEFFRLDPSGRPLFVAGVPPDYFSRNGQLWGNPLYHWPSLKRDGYRWWIKRFRAAFQRFDAVRMDHFIGFHRAWAVPVKHRTARRGFWVPGPGEELFMKAKRAVGRLELIAEDLGAVTPEVDALRRRLSLPGMRVLQFAFGADAAYNPHHPRHFDRHCVVYTGTHDNDTIMGWFKDKKVRKERERALRYAAATGKEFHWDMIRLAYSCAADTAVIPMQDVLGLGTQARMNRPGTASGNWTWRMKKSEARTAPARRLRRLSQTCGRIVK